MESPSILTDPVEALQALRKATVAFINAEASSDQRLRLALDHLIEVTGADAGAVAVPSEGDRRPVLLAERFLDEAGPISRTVLAQALSGASSEAAISEPPDSLSVSAAGITSILCAPVVRQGKILAAVYLDRRGKAPFDEAAVDLAACFSSVLALSVDLTRRVERTEKRAEEARAVAAHVQDFWSFGAIATKNRSFAECLQRAERLARSEATLLILGETGSGKEHLARCVHAESERRDGPFLALNCAAIPEQLLESELFGHERGAFTGAVGMRRGKFELADSGTLFLDEIGDLPLHLQPKLLRVLEDKRIARLGASEERKLDVRIIAATHHALSEAVRAGRFREDLYYRLSVVELRLPPLRERLEDIAPLAEQFLGVESSRASRRLRWEPSALRRLSLHRWPGNVRELRNAVEKLCLLCEGPLIGAADVERFVLPQADDAPRPPQGAVWAQGPSFGLEQRLAQAEQQILQLLDSAQRLRGAATAGPAPGAVEPESATEVPAPPGGNYHELMEAASRRIVARALEQAGSIAGAARLLGLSRQSLSVKCKQLGLEKA